MSISMNEGFFRSLDELVQKNGLTVDRPKGSAHPRYPEYIYPLDYGFINGTTSTDKAEIDAWIGEGEPRVSGIIVTFDPIKRDSEMKVCVGCGPDELQAALASNSRGDMRAILVAR